MYRGVRTSRSELWYVVRCCIRKLETEAYLFLSSVQKLCDCAGEFAALAVHKVTRRPVLELLQATPTCSLTTLTRVVATIR